MLDHAGLEVEAKGKHLVHKGSNMHEKTMHSFVVIVAERLRRLTRNQLGSARVGSSPTRYENTKFSTRGRGTGKAVARPLVCTPALFLVFS